MSDPQVDLPEEAGDLFGMDPTEYAYAVKFYQALMDASVNSERSAQARDVKIGVSDLGYCSERLRRHMLNMVPDDTDLLAAWIGTQLGDGAEEALVAAFPHLIRQAEVRLQMDIDNHRYMIPGHPDLLDPLAGIVWDAKTDFGLDIPRRTGPSDQQQFQRHGYAKAAHAQGLFPNHELKDLRVGNFWIDRGGVDKRLQVQLEPYNEEWVIRAGEWLGEVIYAWLETQQGRETIGKKEPPREVCQATCGFYADCRAFDTDVEGRLTDPVVLESLSMYGEALVLSSTGDRMKKVAKEHLRNINGIGAGYMLRWTWVNATENRAGYNKIDVKPIEK